MALTEILEFHPKGIEYAHLIEPEKGYPLIRDSHGKVLSFPPIINGVDTKVTTESSDFLIDVRMGQKSMPCSHKASCPIII